MAESARRDTPPGSGPLPDPGDATYDHENPRHLRIVYQATSSITRAAKYFEVSSQRLHQLLIDHGIHETDQTRKVYEGCRLTPDQQQFVQDVVDEDGNGLESKSAVLREGLRKLREEYSASMGDER